MQAAGPLDATVSRSPAGPVILAVLRDGHAAVLAAERAVLETGDAKPSMVCAMLGAGCARRSG